MKIRGQLCVWAQHHTTLWVNMDYKHRKLRPNTPHPQNTRTGLRSEDRREKKWEGSTKGQTEARESLSKMTHGNKILKKATSTEDRNPIKLTLGWFLWLWKFEYIKDDRNKARSKRPEHRSAYTMMMLWRRTLA